MLVSQPLEAKPCMLLTTFHTKRPALLGISTTISQAYVFLFKILPIPKTPLEVLSHQLISFRQMHLFKFLPLFQRNSFAACFATYLGS